MKILNKLSKLLRRTPDMVIPPEPAVPLPPPQPRGHVTSGTRSAEFTPDSHRHGGRIVRTMPRQLRAMKEAQERVEDD